MKGLSPQVDLTSFAESELIQLCIGTGQIQFHFSGRKSIDVESAVIFGEKSGHRRIDDYRDGASLLATVLGERLVDVTRQEDGGVLMRFSGDRSIRVLNDSAQFESFQIRVAGQTHVG